MFRVILAVLLFASFSNAEFVKLEKVKGKIVALKTAIVSYEKGEKTVDLVAVVHIGDERYYQQQNKLFKQYDSLCYELVAPKGTKVNKKEKSTFTVILNNLLRLEHQLDIIDYHAKNFVHADMSIDEIKKVLEERGETQVTILLKVVADLIQQQNLAKGKELEVDLLQVLNPNYLKRILAEQLAGKASLGQTLDTILIKDRNKAAFAIILEELKTKNRIGVYYGAAHMEDFEDRLITDGFKKKEVKWLVAWNLMPTEEEMIFELLKKLMENR